MALDNLVPYLKGFFGFGPPMEEEDMQVRRMLGNRDSMKSSEINRLNHLGFGRNIWQELSRRDGFARQTPTVQEIIGQVRNLHSLLLDKPTRDRMNSGLSPSSPKKEWQL